MGSRRRVPSWRASKPSQAGARWSLSRLRPWSVLQAVILCKSLGGGQQGQARSRDLARQSLLNPSSSLFGRLKHRRVTNAAFAEPGFQMPQRLVLRVMVLAVEADDHGGQLVIGEDKVALAVMAVDEHAQGLERDVEGHGLRLVGAKGQMPSGQTPRGTLKQRLKQEKVQIFNL